MPSTDAAITGPRKAAVLLLQLGRDGAAQVMNRLSPGEVEEITTEIVRLRSVDTETAETVLSEFQGLMTNGGAGVGGIGAAQSILESAMGHDHASQILGRLAEASVSQPFAFLADADPKLLLTFLVDEHPQTIALVLAHLRTDQASAILSGLDAQTQVAVAQRIGAMESAAPDQVRLVADVLRRRASSLLQPSSASARVGGVQPLVDIINRADPATERTILESLEQQDPALAEEIRKRLFVFDDIVTLEDKGVQLVLRQVDNAVLAVALKGVSTTVRDKVLGNVSERARENLEEEIDLLGPQRLSAVQEAQAAVVQIIRTLEQSGEIVLRRGGDDELVD
jgi:flagellar motor switch protein FliG